MSTTLLSKQLFTVDLQHSTRLSPLGSGEQLNSETCRMLELLESDMTKEAKARSGGGYSLSFDAPTPRFAPPWSLASLRRAKVRSENKERCYCKIAYLTIVEFSANKIEIQNH